LPKITAFTGYTYYYFGIPAPGRTFSYFILIGLSVISPRRLSAGDLPSLAAIDAYFSHSQHLKIYILLIFIICSVPGCVNLAKDNVKLWLSPEENIKICHE